METDQFFQVTSGPNRRFASQACAPDAAKASQVLAEPGPRLRPLFGGFGVGLGTWAAGSEEELGENRGCAVVLG